MTLDQFITKYNGVRVADGQCGSLVRAYWNEVDLTVPPSYPNSKDYWFNPVPGYDKVHDPQPGNIAIYNGHGAFPEGHSAIYVDNGQVFEQNADPDGSPAHLFNRVNTYLLGYLRKQGANMQPLHPLTRGDIINQWHVRLPSSEPPENYIAAWLNKDMWDLFYDLSNNVPQWGKGEPPIVPNAVKLAPGIYDTRL